MAFYRILWRFNLEKNTVFCFQVQIGSLISGSLILMAIGVVLYVLFAVILVSATGSTMLLNNLIH